MKNILIVKTSALGDLIHTFPVVSYLKSRFPHAQIDWVVENQGADLVQSHPYITRALRVNTKLWRKSPWKYRDDIKKFRHLLRVVDYDCVFDLQGNVKSALITTQARSSCKVGFGWKSVPEWPNVLFTHHRYNPTKGQNIREDYLEIVQQHFHDDKPFHPPGILLEIPPAHQEQIDTILALPYLQNESKVMVCPGSAWKNKQMSEESLKRFLEHLKGHLKCSFLFIWGNIEERDISQRLAKHFHDSSQLIERLPLSTLQNLMNRMNLVVAMDSLPLHLAGTTEAQTFSIFGSSSAEKYKPQGDQHQSYQGVCPYQRTFEKRCPILRTCTTGACIRNLSGDEVFNSFLNSIK